MDLTKVFKKKIDHFGAVYRIFKLVEVSYFGSFIKYNLKSLDIKTENLISS